MACDVSPVAMFFFKILVCVPDIHTSHCPAFAGTLSGRKKGFLRIHKRQQSLDWVFKVSMMNCCDDKSCLIKKVIKIFVWLALPEVSIHPWQDCIWTDNDCLQFCTSQMRQQNTYFLEFFICLHIQRIILEFENLWSFSTCSVSISPNCQYVQVGMAYP